MELHTKVTCFLLLSVLPNGKELFQEICLQNFSIVLDIIVRNLPCGQLIKTFRRKNVFENPTVRLVSSNSSFQPCLICSFILVQ